MTKTAPGRRFYHKTDTQTYRFSNSIRGYLYARTHGYVWTDTDSNWVWSDDRTRRVAMACHWGTIGQEGFLDPQGQYGPKTKWTELTVSEAQRLVSPEGTHPKTMLRMIASAKAKGIRGIEWEVKGGHWHTATFLPVLAAAKANGIRIVIKTGTWNAAAIPNLRAAKAATVAARWGQTMLLNHETQPVRLNVSDRVAVDYVRGKWRKA